MKGEGEIASGENNSKFVGVRREIKQKYEKERKRGSIETRFSLLSDKREREKEREKEKKLSVSVFRQTNFMRKIS